ncbi:MAG: type II toxin-antitoxin system VapC family toxin [Anaerolineales bacterium]|nr:type II toxin-antitoxin system VapC family toxin [Anaerolineales bacterium]
MITKVFDSFALMAFLQDEPGAQIVEDLILDAQQGNVKLAICVVNLGEIWYSISRTTSTETAENYIQQIQSMPIEIVDVDWILTRQAASFKAKGNISYADCFAAALAKIREGEVVTGDKEFLTLESDITIVWLDD